MDICTLADRLFTRLGGKDARTVVMDIMPGCQRTFASDDGTNVYNHFLICLMFVVYII
jgi:hypothetical protein